ncbi:tail fiber domain-containing protein [Ornithobacterium rhinotracheale]|uniref:tail fiber domain-containing protein n=1 Tax=Ornithobacterium rhinotracheale TaxID=28251 RepID=UPI001FF16571|nr:tail fiber domain-containing protein [Ornithobacterium rhinotracheale]MCK0199155.1 tail fiber domain-containing protein [Ornithobacterium rhinotracheale]
MKKLYIILTSLWLGIGASQAQVYLPNRPDVVSLPPSSNVFLDASSKYDTQNVGSNNKGKGLVFPQVDLRTFEFDITTPDGAEILPTFYDGMVVYNTGKGSTISNALKGGIQVEVEPGFYYFSNPDGRSNLNVQTGRWMKLGGQGVVSASQNIYTTNGTISGQRTVTFQNDNSNIVFSKQGTDNENPLLVLNGSIKASAVDLNSDRRLKKDIKPILEVSTVDRLIPVSYYWNAEGKKKGGNDKLQYGFIAQEVERVFPNLVYTDQQGYKTVNYVELIPVLTKALQQEKKRNDEQQAEIEQLKRIVKELQNK